MSSGGKKSSTFVDDVFSTYLYYGNCPDNNLNTTQTITNGINLSEEGGLVWTKHRTGLLFSAPHVLVDTERGVNKYLSSNDSDAEVTENSIFAFNSNGFTLKGQGPQGGTNYGEGSTTTAKYSSWTFRKAKGFFDIVTYSGNGVSGRTISHGLGCVPGLIIIKSTTDANSWFTYHKDLGPTKYLMLNHPNTEATQSWFMNDTAPTATEFTLGNSSNVNGSGTDYVVYLFASEDTSTAATARSVYYPAASGNGVRTNASNDFNVGTSDFTLEGYFYYENVTNGYQVLFDQRSSSSTEISLIAGKQPDGKVYIENGPDGYGGTMILRTAQPEITEVNKWYHIAFSRHSGTLKLFINGVEKGSVSTSVNFGGNNWQIGNAHQQSGNYAVLGYMSNIRFIKGQGIYTSAFTPSTEPLTTTSQGATASNVKLLCFQNTTVNGTTVNASGGWVSNVGTPVVSTFSPFLDAASPSNTFGEGGDQNIIKFGSYYGNGDTTNGTKINLGFEPQWLLIKSTGFQEHWHQFDVMRGIINGGNDLRLEANQSGGEYTAVDFVSVDSDGFTVFFNPNVNKNNERFVYMAIRRPDGLAGKPAEVGTDVFAMAYGNSAGTNPSYVSNFPVGFGLLRQPATQEAWYASARLTGTKYLFTNSTTNENTSSNFVFDHNNGWRDGGAVPNYLSWMWKRHAGFDVVTYKGNGTIGRQMPHSLGVIPEMIWVKRRNANEHWYVYHKGVNGGTNPGDYMLYLDDTNSKIDHDQAWNNSLPTSTHFILGNDTAVNSGGTTQYIAMLFASVEGISKVDSYIAPTTPNEYLNIDCGFVPRFIIIKGENIAQDWAVFDTVRGLTASVGNDPFMALNDSYAQISSEDCVELTSTGFRIREGWNIRTSQSGYRYIFYAHA